MIGEHVRMEPLSVWMASMSIYTGTEPPTGLYWTWRVSMKPCDDLNHWDLGIITLTLGLPGGTFVKNLPASVGGVRDTGSVPGSGRFPEGGNGTPLQYSCLENSTHRRAWWAAIPGVTKSNTQLSTHAHTPQHYLGILTDPPSKPRLGYKYKIQRNNASQVEVTEGELLERDGLGKGFFFLKVWKSKRWASLMKELLCAYG